MYMQKSMDHITFQGGSGTTRRGEFTTTSSGIGDTKITGMFRLLKNNTNSSIIFLCPAASFNYTYNKQNYPL